MAHHRHEGPARSNLSVANRRATFAPCRSFPSLWMKSETCTTPTCRRSAMLPGSSSTQRRARSGGSSSIFGARIFLRSCPLVRGRAGFQPLFPRYVFVGIAPELSARPHRRHSRRAVHSALRLATRSRSDARCVRRRSAPGWMRTESYSSRSADPEDPLFAKRARERTRALLMFAEAGFRIKSA